MQPQLDLANETCPPCGADTRPMDAQEAQQLMAHIPNWSMHESGQKIHRRLTFKGFAKAAYCANLSMYVSDLTFHHADVQFGWGYCQIDYTSHDVGGLTRRDFICAAKLDLLLDKE